MKFYVVINVLHTDDGTITDEFRTHMSVDLSTLGMVVEQAYRDALAEHGPNVALDLTVTQSA